jgi:hypothetical protein
VSNSFKFDRPVSAKIHGSGRKRDDPKAAACEMLKLRFYNLRAQVAFPDAYVRPIAQLTLLVRAMSTQKI